MSERATKPPRKAYLVINSQIYPIMKETTRIGRKLDNDIVIQDAMVSRYHAEIKQEEGLFHIVDLDSTSGTFLNQKKVTKTQLFSGDVILLANVPIMFIDDSAGITSSLNKNTGVLDKEDE